MLGSLYFFLSASILLFILHTIILIGLKNNPTAFDSLNTFFLDSFFGLLSFDSMGVSWLYISSFINIFCQLLIFINLNHLTNSTTTSISRKTGWVALNTENSYSWWIIYLSIIHLSLTFLFLTDNIIIFYISFETTLLPFFLWIGEAAIRSSSWHAVFFLTFFTLIGSVGMLWSIAILYNLTNSFIISEYLYSIALTANIEFLSMLEKCTLCTLNGTSVEVSFEECESFWLNTAYTPTDSRKSLWVAFFYLHSHF